MFAIIAPTSPKPSCALIAMPKATPACGNNVMPKYFLIVGSLLTSLAERFAPKYLPIHLNIMYVTPTKTIVPFAITPRSNSAPL